MLPLNCSGFSKHTWKMHSQSNMLFRLCDGRCAVSIHTAICVCRHVIVYAMAVATSPLPAMCKHCRPRSNWWRHAQCATMPNQSQSTIVPISWAGEIKTELAQMGSHPITFLWLWPATDHEPHCRHCHMAGICSDCSIGKMNECSISLHFRSGSLQLYGYFVGVLLLLLLVLVLLVRDYGLWTLMA